ncbi:MAG: hypothetical protein FWE89_04930 [Syntrophaceae bacterium]|nr:hypothetical protein [Syntrophaceae bacterium]
MTGVNAYEVLWPQGRRVKTEVRLAKRLDTLEGKVVCELWDWIFKGDQMFAVWEQELAKRYSGIRFVSWKEFGEIHGSNEKEVLASLPEKLKEHGCDAVICGVGC